MIKMDSGWGWGPWNLKGDSPWSLYSQHAGGQVLSKPRTAWGKPTGLAHDLDQARPWVHKGNDFQHWSNPNLYRQDKESLWFFWDNSLATGELSSKEWTRIVPRSQMPGRVEESLAQQSLARIVRDCPQWQQPRAHKPRPQSNLVVVLEPSAQVCWHYLGLSLDQLRTRLRAWCQEHTQGLELEFQPKLSRKQRQPLAARLNRDLWAVVSLQSAAGLEVELLGHRSVELVLGSGTGVNPSVTSLKKPLLSQPEEIEQRYREILAVTWPKTDLLSARWSQEPWWEGIEPQRPRSLDF